MLKKINFNGLLYKKKNNQNEMLKIQLSKFRNIIKRKI